jgi:hypothetical protein
MEEIISTIIGFLVAVCTATTVALMVVIGDRVFRAEPAKTQMTESWQ